MAEQWPNGVAVTTYQGQLTLEAPYHSELIEWCRAHRGVWYPETKRWHMTEISYSDVVNLKALVWRLWPTGQATKQPYSQGTAARPGLRPRRRVGASVSPGQGRYCVRCGKDWTCQIASILLCDGCAALLQSELAAGRVLPRPAANVIVAPGQGEAKPAPIASVAPVQAPGLARTEQDVDAALAALFGQ